LLHYTQYLLSILMLIVQDPENCQQKQRNNLKESTKKQTKTTERVSS
jgi:hypothetical protein